MRFDRKIKLQLHNKDSFFLCRLSCFFQRMPSCISDFCHFKKPDLNIMDAYKVTMRNGPQRARENDLKLMKTLLISTDIVAIDAAASKLFGKEPETISHISYGKEDRIGRLNLEELNIKKIDLMG